MDCLFRVERKDHYELLSVRTSTYDKLKKDDSYNPYSLLILVSSRGVQSIIGVIFIIFAIGFLFLHSTFHRFKSNRTYVKKNPKHLLQLNRAQTVLYYIKEDILVFDMVNDDGLH